MRLFCLGSPVHGFHTVCINYCRTKSVYSLATRIPLVRSNAEPVGQSRLSDDRLGKTPHTVHTQSERLDITSVGSIVNTMKGGHISSDGLARTLIAVGVVRKHEGRLNELSGLP